ncbi:MAG: CAP domain-containing protein, partial [Ruminiclostridium sp.]
VEAAEAYQKVDSSSATVTASGVNLRIGPATTFDSICKLNKDQKVTVIGKLGSWYAVYVSSSGNVGAISAQFLKFDKAKVTTNSKKATTTKSTQSTPKVTVKANTKAITTTSKVKDISSDEQALLDLVNKARKAKNLKALEFDAGLVKVARLKVKDMLNNNYFSHTSKFYGTPFDMMKKYEIKFSAAGENIAGNQTIEKVVKAWSDESGNNLFNEKFTHTGIGIVNSPTYGKLFVEMFIKK